MDVLWRAAYGIIIGVSIWLLHSTIGEYPPPLPQSATPGRDIRRVVALWAVALIAPVLRMFVLSPWLDEACHYLANWLPSGFALWAAGA